MLIREERLIGMFAKQSKRRVITFCADFIKRCFRKTDLLYDNRVSGRATFFVTEKEKDYSIIRLFDYSIRGGTKEFGIIGRREGRKKRVQYFRGLE